MKHSFRYGVPFILFFSIIAISHTSARFLHAKQGEKMMEVDESINTSENSLVDLETINSFGEVMGMENCGSEDEECLKRTLLQKLTWTIFTLNTINLEISHISPS